MQSYTSWKQTPRISGGADQQPCRQSVEALPILRAQKDPINTAPKIHAEPNPRLRRRPRPPPLNKKSQNPRIRARPMTATWQQQSSRGPQNGKLQKWSSPAVDPAAEQLRNIRSHKHKSLFPSSDDRRQVAEGNKNGARRSLLVGGPAKRSQRPCPEWGRLCS